MSDFLDHKKAIDPAAWVAMIPEKWRLPVMLGGPALLIILLIPFLFRDERARPIDRNTVDGIANTVRKESRLRAAYESALDEALKRKLAADQASLAASAAGAGGGAAVASGKLSLTPGAAAASAAGGDQTAGAPAGQPGAARPMAQQTPALRGARNAAAGAGSGADGPAGAAGNGKPFAAAPGAPSAQGSALGAPPQLHLRAFDWRGPGAGAGREILTAQNLDLGGGGGHFQAGSAQSSAFEAGASAYSGGAGTGGSAGGSGSGGSLGSPNSLGTGGGAGPGGVHGADASGLAGMAKQCQEQNALYQPQISDKQKQLNGYENFRSQHNCKNIGCGNCQVPSGCYDSHGNYDPHRSWFNYCNYYKNYVCPCVANRCAAQKTCSDINSLQQQWKKGCPMTQDQSAQSALDCGKV